MKFVIVNHGYPQFLDWLYREACPGLGSKSFVQQRQAYYRALFATSDFYAHALQSLGHEVEEFVFNCDPMQLAWRREHLGRGGARQPGLEASSPTVQNAADTNAIAGEGVSSYGVLELVQSLKHAVARTPFRNLARPLARPMLDYVNRRSTFGFPLFVEQVRQNRPDVLFVQTLYAFDNEQLAELKRHTGMLVGEQAVMPVPDDIDFRYYDLVVSSFPPLVAWMRAHGVRAELMRLAFDPRVDAMIPAAERTVPVGFVGSVFPMHSSRLTLLEGVAAKIPGIEVHGNITIDVAPDSPLRGRVQQPLWGRDMYAFLRRSKATLNHHGDVLPHANNLRLYEATGMGCLLVTDYKDDLGEMFEPEKEVVSYRSAEECVDKASFYLEERNAAARERISAAGRRRTLTEHTYKSRVDRLVNLIRSE